jgi:hypothetical protein
MQVIQEAMLLQQSFSIAHASMVALDKDAPALSGHNTRCRKGTRTRGQYLYGLTADWKLAQQVTEFRQRQRRPVGFHKRTVHPVRL